MDCSYRQLTALPDTSNEKGYFLLYGLGRHAFPLDAVLNNKLQQFEWHNITVAQISNDIDHATRQIL